MVLFSGNFGAVNYSDIGCLSFKVTTNKAKLLQSFFLKLTNSNAFFQLSFCWHLFSRCTNLCRMSSHLEQLEQFYLRLVQQKNCRKTCS